MQLFMEFLEDPEDDGVMTVPVGDLRPAVCN